MEPFGVNSLLNASDSAITSPPAWVSGFRLHDFAQGIRRESDDLDSEKEENNTSESQSSASYDSAHPLSFFPGISTLIAKGVYDSAFPLHDVSTRSGIPSQEIA